jgi:hypothetical protein
MVPESRARASWHREGLGQRMSDRAQAGPKPRVERRLAAILAADVGYSRLMGVDETGTLTPAEKPTQGADRTRDRGARRSHRQADGDGALAEFASAVDAARRPSGREAAAVSYGMWPPVSDGGPPAVAPRESHRRRRSSRPGWWR